MSITIHHQPQQLTPVYNQMIIAVTSSNQTQTNFQFVGDIYVAGDLVTRMKVPVNPDGYGVFDIHRHIENQVTYTFTPGSFGWTQAVDSYATYSVEFSEEFRFEWPFYDNIFLSGNIGFVGLTSISGGGEEPLFDDGAQIFISQTEPYTNNSYNGIAEITEIGTMSSASYFGGLPFWYVKTNKSFVASTPAEGGTMSLANFALNIIPTGDSTGQLEVWNGVESFQDFINYDYTEYIPEPISYGSSISINSYTDNGGNLQINLFSAHGMVVGDFLLVTGAYAPYNGVWEVIEINSTTQLTVNNTYAGNILNGAEYVEQKSGYGIANWLTNVPEDYKIGTQSQMKLLLYKQATNQQKDFYVRTNNTGTFRITSAYSASSPLGYDALTQIACGPWDLINNGQVGFTSSISTGTSSLPIIDENTTSYQIWTQNQILEVDTATISFVIDNSCSRYEKIQLIFMDKKGSFIPYTFNRVNRENRSISRSDYQQRYGSYAPASQNWGYNSWDRGKKNLDTVVTESYTVNSDWVDQTTSNFLMELFESPQVYWINEDGLTQAINITSNSTERKQTINDQIINYTLTFELSNKNMSQRG